MVAGLLYNWRNRPYLTETKSPAILPPCVLPSSSSCLLMNKNHWNRRLAQNNTYSKIGALVPKQATGGPKISGLLWQIVRGNWFLFIFACLLILYIPLKHHINWNWILHKTAPDVSTAKEHLSGKWRVYIRTKKWFGKMRYWTHTDLQPLTKMLWWAKCDSTGLAYGPSQR